MEIGARRWLVNLGLLERIELPHGCSIFNSEERAMLSCFSLAWAMQVCIAIVIIVALWSIIQLLLPYVMQFLPGVVVEIIRIVIWAVIAIAIIIVIFGLISCLFGVGGALVPFHH